eukprot:1142975-Pelagomonas_calceolata.AAC.5
MDYGSIPKVIDLPHMQCVAVGFLGRALHPAGALLRACPTFCWGWAMGSSTTGTWTPPQVIFLMSTCVCGKGVCMCGMDGVGGKRREGSCNCQPFRLQSQHKHLVSVQALKEQNQTTCLPGYAICHGIKNGKGCLALSPYTSNVACGTKPPD